MLKTIGIWGLLCFLVYADSLELSKTVASYSLPHNKAVVFCKNLIEDGKNDWRLPHIKELYFLVHRTHQGDYCSATPYRYGRYLGDYRADNYFYVSKEGLIQEGRYDMCIVRCVRRKK